MKNILDFGLPILDWKKNPKSKIKNPKLVFAALMLIAATSLADDSDLVKAAKASGGPHKKSKARVITNADVKKSNGKLVVLPARKMETAAAPAPVKSEIAAAEEAKKARALTAKNIAEAQARVSKLEKELAAVEQSYYESNDPDARDKVITKKFAETKQKLEVARRELASARSGNPSS